MARAALPGRLTWQLATVAEVVADTGRTSNIVLDAPGWGGHLAGQHLDVRLTAEDGYTAQRSYSIASAPEDDQLVLTVERIEEGEVSPYLVGELRAGDELELRGPIGGYFVWAESGVKPVQMIAGGSGIVPFRSMLRHRAAAASTKPVRLLYSSRSLDDVIYREELDQLSSGDGVDVRFTLTREWPDDWTGSRGRIDRALLAREAWAADEQPTTFVCGPSGFVEAATESLIEDGHEPQRIKTERFGPSGS